MLLEGRHPKAGWMQAAACVAACSALATHTLPAQPNAGKGHPSKRQSYWLVPASNPRKERSEPYSSHAFPGLFGLAGVLVLPPCFDGSAGFAYSTAQEERLHPCAATQSRWC